MSGHILIVDAVPTNRIVLKVKLSSAYYETSQAASSKEALALAHKQPPSAILLGDLPEANVCDLVKLLRADPKTAQIPLLVLLTSPDSAARCAVLKAGADDVVSKPIDDVVLLARLRSLQRAREAEDELFVRENTHRALGLAEAPSGFNKQGLVCFLRAKNEDRHDLFDTLAEQTTHRAKHATAKQVMSGTFDAEGAQVPDVFVLLLETDDDSGFGLQILPELRTRASTRHAAVVAIVADDMRRTSATLLDMGANDLVRLGDLSMPEMLWRLDKLVGGKQKADKLRNTTQVGLRAAVTDPLTGLYNRRYALPHLTRMAELSRETGQGFAVMVADIDHFKSINDRYGHMVGDAVLRDVSSRLRDRLRAVDMVARLGGEEFLIVMPDTRLKAAVGTAQRLCRLVSDYPFFIDSAGIEVQMTISIGITMSDAASLAGAALSSAQTYAENLIRDADHALYEAKAHGRNKVELFHDAA